MKGRGRERGKGRGGGGEGEGEERERGEGGGEGKGRGKETMKWDTYEYQPTHNTPFPAAATPMMVDTPHPL